MASQVRHILQPAKDASVGARLQRRIDLLADWILKGIPEGQWVPKSLRAAALWHDDELDIQPIVSATSYSKTHPVHGARARSLDALVRELRTQRGPQTPKAPEDRPGQVLPEDKIEDLQRQCDALQNALSSAVSKWSTEREEGLRQEKRARNLEVRVAQLRAKIDEQTAVIAELQRNQDTRSSLKIIR